MTNESVEREKFTFEIKKWEESLAVEKEKLRLKKKKMWFTMGSIVIPLLVVAATIYGNTLAQKSESQAAFELKTAEVILSAKTVRESQNRIDGLAALFPDHLPADFSNRLQMLRESLQHPTMDKHTLLNLLIAAPKERRKEVMDLWLMFYPDDRNKLPSGLNAFVENR